MTFLRGHRRRTLTLATASVAALVVAGVVTKVAVEEQRAADVVANVGTSSVSYPTLPSQVLDVSVYVENHGQDVVQFRGASLVPVDGYHPAELKHVGVYGQPNMPVLSTQWPPLSPSTAGSAAFSAEPLPVQELAGYVLAPKKVVTLVYAIQGDGTIGTFVAGGVRLSYSYRGRSGSSVAWGAGVNCVSMNARTLCQDGIGDAVLTKVNELSRAS